MKRVKPVITLTPVTTALIDSLKSLDWFTNVGKPISGADVERAYSWKEAGKLCVSRKQQNVQLEGSNILTEKLCFQARERYQNWNDLVFAIRKLWDPICAERILPIKEKNHLPQAFFHAVDLDVVYACMEYEYADLIPPRFAEERLGWYLAGHFPCGWDGDFPEGKLIVF